MHFRKEWHRRGGAENQRNPPPPPEKPLVQPRRVGTRWRIPHELDVLGGPRKHSRHLWVWLGQRYHTRRGQRSRVVIPGERGLALRCSDRHLVIRGGTEGNGWGTPLSRGPSPNQRYPRRLPSAWGVRNSTWGSPHRNPQITSDSTGCCAAPCARTNARSRQRQRDPAMFDTAESIAQLRDGHVPTRRTWTIHESFLSVLNAQTREAVIVTVLRRQRSTAPRNARVIRHLYKDAITRVNREICSLVLKHAGELVTAHSWCDCLHGPLFSRETATTAAVP